MVRILRKEGIFVLAHAAGISARASQVETLLRRWIRDMAEHLRIEDPSTVKDSREELEKTFSGLLSRTAAAEKVVCLIDALNQFERTPSARYLTWLPKLWHKNARLITFAIPGTETETLKNKAWLENLPLPLLAEIESEDIAHTVCERHHKTINPGVLKILLSKRLPDGNPSAGNPLWLALSLEELLLLDADDFSRMDRDFEGTAEQKLLALLKDAADKLPPDIESLYEYMLQRTEDVYGEKPARSFACLTALSRTGLREQDFRHLLPETAGEPWDDLRFAALRRGFRAHLAQRGAYGQWDFTHSQMRIAIRRRSLTDKAVMVLFHTAIAGYLLGLPPNDDLRASETMHHLIEANDPMSAALYYSGLTVPLAAPNPATQTLSDRILTSEDPEAKAEVSWTASLLEQPGLQPAQIAALCNRFQFDLDYALKKEGRLGPRRSMLEAARIAGERLASSDPTNAEWQRDLSVSYDNIGDVLLGQGDLSGALKSYRESLSVRERLASSDPTNAEWQRDLFVSYWRMADISEKTAAGRANQWWRKAYDQLSDMKKRGIMLPTDEQFLTALRQKVQDT